MITGQTGIFALGDAAHGFFEFTRRDGGPRDAEQIFLTESPG